MTEASKAAIRGMRTRIVGTVLSLLAGTGTAPAGVQ
jgi:hypothetical protein